MPAERNRTRLSVVVPVYDVEEYLPEFLRSLPVHYEAPSEFIFVDDGSTDAGAALIERWIATTGSDAHLIRTENRGVSAARNSGMDAATGDWLCFLDPDDVLGAGYFEHLCNFIGEHPEADLVATALRRIHDPALTFVDNHPLRFRFAGGSRVAELGDDLFVMNAASVAFPVEALRRSGARFRTGLHASEDALFVTEYLLALGRPPFAGFVAEACYGYRKRAARTSAVDRYRTDPSTYTLRFRDGYQPLLRAAAETGAVPSWLQSIILYEMQWLLPTQLSPTKHAKFLTASERSEALSAMSGCLRFVDGDRLLRYDATALPLESRLLILALTDRPLWDWVGAYASMPRGWRQTANVIGYTVGGDEAQHSDSASWFPDYFDQRVLRATRILQPDTDERVSIVGREVAVVRPRAGETIAQTQDRHRREAIGIDYLFLPAQEQEVYVRRTRPWANSSADGRVIRRERRRREIWSKDAMIGRMFRPGQRWLIEHDPNDATDLAQQLKDLADKPASVELASARGSSMVRSAIPFGSFIHRIARARATMIVSTRPEGRPSPRARLRGLRVLVLRAPLDDKTARQVRIFNPDRVLTTAPGDRDLLCAMGTTSSDIIRVSNLSPDLVAATLTDIVLADRSSHVKGLHRAH